MSFNPNWIIGKTVSRVQMCSFNDGRGGRAHLPIVYFTDGSSIALSAVETEIEPGVSITYFSKPKSARGVAP